MFAFVVDQFVEYGQHLFAVLVEPQQRFAELRLLPLALQQFLDDRFRHVDIAAQGIGGVASKEQPIEEGGLLVRGGGIEIVPSGRGSLLLCCRHGERVSINTPLKIGNSKLAMPGRLGGTGSYHSIKRAVMRRMRRSRKWRRSCWKASPQLTAKTSGTKKSRLGCPIIS
ncbi:MAG: hypothetical protein NT090_05415 [Acidobacteria bacterium]|nr:hypothetical protein [Acidobacteriota bacterium]